MIIVIAGRKFYPSHVLVINVMIRFLFCLTTFNVVSCAIVDANSIHDAREIHKKMYLKCSV